MKGTLLLVPVVVLVSGIVDAQPLIEPGESAPPIRSDVSRSEASESLPRVDFGASSRLLGPGTAAGRAVEDGRATQTRQLPAQETRSIGWVGLLLEQARIDGMMHAFRIATEPATREKLTQGPYFKMYASAVKGYFDHEPRWQDGDGFAQNDINHPLMGAISSHVYTNHDRRCSGLQYGEPGYWRCIRRATVFSALASANWEWNPLMSESAIGNVGRFHHRENGKWVGDGGFTDFVMTPLGGMAVRVAGDYARARLWPYLDSHLSGNIAARIAKVALKIATDPAGVANAGFNFKLRGALSSTPSGQWKR